jgi:hypothetical protein
MWKVIFSLVLFLSLGSCIEISDDISFKTDGSGTFKYLVNLSSSKIKVNSILSLDSLDGKKIPSIYQLKEKIEQYKEKIDSKEGISNVKLDANFTDFIFKFSCDFSSVTTLQNAFKDLLNEFKVKSSKIDEVNWLLFEKNKVVRSVPILSLDLTSRLKKEDSEALKRGKYTSISRFDRPIERFDNSVAKLSANKMAVMIQTTPFSLIQNIKLLENTIYLVELK